MKARAAAKRKRDEETRFIANKALRLARQLAKSVDRKFIQTTVDLTVAIAGDAYQSDLLNGVGQGSSDFTRLGSTAHFKTLDYCLRSLSTASYIIRILVIHDPLADGTAITWTDVFADAECLRTVYRPYKDRRKFKVLMDKLQVVPLDTGYMHTWKGTINLRNLETDYGLGAAGTIADISRGSLYLFVNAVENTAAVDLDGYIVATFVDS